MRLEEAALDGLRKKLAKLRVRVAAVPPDTGSEEAKGWLGALVSDLGMRDPDRLRATFARAFGPLVLTPCPEGYRITGNIKAPVIRAGSGGLSPSNSGCGGAIAGLSSTPSDYVIVGASGRRFQPGSCLAV